MKLSTYIANEGISYREFGERVGVTGEQIGRIINGHRIASLALAVRIERETGGKVKATSFAPDQPRRKSA